MRKIKMIKLILATTILFTSTSVFAATAYWTGQQKQVQTVTYKWAWNCQYRYAGKAFWMVFVNSCPGSIQVQ